MEKSQCFSAEVSAVPRFCYLSLVSLISQFHFAALKLIAGSTAVQVQYEPAIPAFQLNIRLREIARDFQDAFEAAVSYLELMIAPAFGDHGIAPNAAHHQLALRTQH